LLFLIASYKFMSGIVSLVAPKTCDSSWLHKLTVALCVSLIKASESMSTKSSHVGFSLYQVDYLNEAEIECEL